MCPLLAAHASPSLFFELHAGLAFLGGVSCPHPQPPGVSPGPGRQAVPSMAGAMKLSHLPSEHPSVLPAGLQVHGDKDLFRAALTLAEGEGRFQQARRAALALHLSHAARGPLSMWG